MSRDPSAPFHTSSVLRCLQSSFARGSREHWLQALASAGLTVSPINSVREALSHEQVVARGLIQSTTIERPSCTGDGTSESHRLHLVGPPVRLSGTPQTIRRPPPGLGEHTREVLSEVLAWPHSRVDAALRSGAASQAAPARSYA